MKIKPQLGPQEQFLSSSADIVIYGGAAGGGKTYGLLLEPLRHINNNDFGCVIFRKNANQIFAEGGLWDTAYSIYPFIGGKPKSTPHPSWTFPSGMKISFGHIDHEDDVLKWQGSQIPLIAFDELTHFSEKQFFYMMSRNRSGSGVAGYIRATCNPDADSWVAKFIRWWWDGNTGYPIPERSGKIRYFVRQDGELYWGDTKDELCNKLGLNSSDRDMIKSMTFVASKLTDNKILMKKDPGYLANLKALALVEQERLLNGNWKIRPAAGLFFNRANVEIVNEIPNDVIRWVRAWDLAATEKKNKKNSESESGQPACTAGVLMGKRQNGRYIVADVINVRLKANDVRTLIKNTAVIDRQKYKRIRTKLPQDPGQAGKEQAESYVRLLAGFDVLVERESGSKETRAEPVSAQWLSNNFDVLIADWNEAYFSQLESFPESTFKDMVDATSSAFNELEKVSVTSAPTLSGKKSSHWRGL